MILAFAIIGAQIPTQAQAQSSSQAQSQSSSQSQASPQSQTPAQDSAKRTELKLLFHLMQQDSMINKVMDAMYGSMSSRVISQLKDSGISADGAQMREMHEYLEKTRQYSKDMVRRLINEDMVAIYAKYFTTKEIEDFVAFYQSSSGQALLRHTPDLTKEMMSVMYSKYLPEMQKLIADDMQKITNEKTDAK